MGNKLFNQYNIDKKPFLTGGYLNMWKIHKATHKDRKQDACIFVFDKKQLEPYSPQNREGILNILRKEASSLIKYKHPSILGIFEPLAEDKQTMGFVTEPFEYSMSSWYETLKPSKLEIKLMITELCKVICFLHEDAHVIHSNINPEVIFIDKANKIKIGGMNFAIDDPPVSGAEVLYNNTSVPNLNYTAPELIFENKAFFTSDTFNVGLIIFSMLELHKGNSQYKNLINLSSNTIENYKAMYGQIDSKLGRTNFDSDDMSILYTTLNRTASSRPKPRDLLDGQWFNDPKLKALYFVENFAANDMNKNVEFLSKFPKIAGMFEHKLITQRFFPCILGALKNEQLINAALPAVFSICENPELKMSFATSLWPRLKEIFQMKSIPAASLYFLLKKIPYIADNTSNSEFSGNFLNLICKALDCNVQKIQIVVVKNLDVIAKKIDSLAFKNQIYPRMIKMCTDNSPSSFKVEILLKLKTLYTKLDQTIINDSLLTNLEKIRKIDNSTEVCICIANFYEEISKVATVEAIGNKILPNVVQILLAGRISRSSFEALMRLVQNFLDKIRKAREKELTDDISKFSGDSTSPFPDAGNNQNQQEKEKKDDFLGALLNEGEPKTSSTVPMPNDNLKPLSMPGTSSFGTNSSGGNTFGMNLNNTNSFGGNSKPAASSNLDFLDGLGVPSSTSSSSNMMNLSGSGSKPSSNLFQGLNTNTSTNTGVNNMFANMNINSNTSNSSANKPMNSLDFGSSTTNTNNTLNFGNLGGSSFGQGNTYGKSNSGNTLESLMMDLPTSANNFGNSSKPAGDNTIGGMGNWNNSTSGNTGGFNQNSLDFLSPSASSNKTGSGNNINFDFSVGTSSSNTNAFGNMNSMSGGMGSNMNKTNNSNNLGGFDLFGGNSNNNQSTNTGFGNQFDFTSPNQSSNNKPTSNNPFDFY